MADISVRDLRNNGGRVLQRVAKGESLTVTLDGRPVAELHPLAAPTLANGLPLYACNADDFSGIEEVEEWR